MRQLWSSFLITLVLNGSLIAQDRPKIGVAFSGGGVKGFAQIGVLKVFEEIGLPVDYISGSSMGSIVGGLYAIGYSAAELEEIVLETDWENLFSDHVGRRTFTINQKLWDERTLVTLPVEDFSVSLPSGLKTGQKVSRLLCRLTLPVHDIDDFSRFRIPFVCLATDLETGEGVRLKSGFLPEALRASMGIPSVFTPIEIDGRRLIDGGEVRTIPVEDLEIFDPDIIIAIDATSRLYEKEQLKSLLTIYDQTIRFQKVQSNLQQLELADVVIRPNFKGLGIADFNQSRNFIERGEEAARVMLPQLKALLDSLQLDSNHEVPDSVMLPDSIYITSIFIRGEKVTSEALALRELNIDVPSMFTLDQLDRISDRVYNLQFFERVTYQVLPDALGSKLILHVVERNIDEFGFGLRYDNVLDTAVLLNTLFRNVLADNSLLNLDLKLGRQVRFDAQYLIPVGLLPSSGVRLRFNYVDDLLDVFVDGTKQARTDVTTTFGEVLFGNLFSNSVTLTAGFRLEHMRSAADIATFSLADSLRVSNTVVPFVYQLWIDTIDRATYPTSGLFAIIKNEMASEALGSNTTFSRHLFNLRAFVPVSSNFTITSALLLATGSGEIPPFYEFFLGGIDRSVILPDRQQSAISFLGLKTQEILGHHAQFLQLGLQYEFLPKYFAILRCNAGNAFETWELDLSPDRFIGRIGLTLGRMTPIGPLEVTAMSGSRHDLLWHVNLGYRF